MKMQKLFENWSKFKSDILMEDIINEISSQYTDYVERWMSNNGGELQLPFNDMFGGDTNRTVIPLGTAMAPGSDMANILTWLEQQGYKTDFKTGLASKEFKSYTGKPGAPGTKEVMRVKQQKIGKVLQRAHDLQKKIDDAVTFQSQRSLEWYAANPGERGSAIQAPDGLANDPTYKRHQDTAKKMREEYAKHFRSDIYVGRAKKFVDYWNKNSRYYRENPDEMMIDYSVIITRHPIDVLRMSDFDNIHSCHSQDGDYFACAIKEATSAGAIAYIVETEDLDQIDVDDDEIFEDAERGIGGIEPLGRIRLRKFDKTGDFASDNKYSLLLPEKREYGTTIPGFYDAVKDWAVKSQEPKWSQDLKEDGTLDPNILRDFVRKGGEYKDTPSRHIFMNAFADYGGKQFEHAEGGRWQDEQSEAERMAQGIEHYIEEMDDYAYTLERNADHIASVDEVKGLGGVPYIQNLEWKVVNPLELGRRGDEEWSRGDTYEAAEAENDPSYGPYPEIYFNAMTVLRVQLNGPNAAEYHELNDNEKESLGNDIWTAMQREGTNSTYLDDYYLEEESRDDTILDFHVMYGGITQGADRHDGVIEAPNHILEFQELIDTLDENIENLANLKKAMISALQVDGYAKPSLSDVLKKDIEEERQNFSKFLLRMDNAGGYSLMYPMHGEELLPDNFNKEDEVVAQIPAGRMPTREILHSVFGDVRSAGSYRVPSYISPKFTRQVIDRMAKLFAQAHMAAKKGIGKQQELPLQEQQEEDRNITVEDIQDYIAKGFTLALADVTYIKGSGTSGSSNRADFTPPTGVPRQTTLAMVRFVLDDESYRDLSFSRTEELLAAALNFVKMLDEDISLLSKEVTGVLQSLSHKEEGKYAQQGADIKKLLNDIGELVTKIDEELNALVMEWKNDPEKWKKLAIDNLSTPDNFTARIPGQDGRRHHYVGMIGRAFEGTTMEQYVDSRLDILDDLGRQGRTIRAGYDHPDNWSKFTDEIKSVYEKDLAKIYNSHNRLQTVEELSRLFETAPSLMNIIREEILTVLGR